MRRIFELFNPENKRELRAIAELRREFKESLDKINYQLGSLVEQLSAIRLDADVSKLAASIDNINRNVSELFDCVIALERDKNAQDK